MHGLDWMKFDNQQHYIYIYLVGGFKPSEKYESQLGWFFPIYGKIKNVQNQQPYIYI